MKKRTTDLFRFITLRSPETISTFNKKLGFVFPDPDSTAVFLDELDYTSGDIDSEELMDRTVSFTPFEKVSEIKSLDTTFFEFSIWLAKNKNNLSAATIASDVPMASLSAAEIDQIWDNLLYDILKPTNPYIRQVCLQILIADNFFHSYAAYAGWDDEDGILRRLANAKVVVPKAYSQVKTVTAETLPIYQVGRKKFGLLHKAQLAGLSITSLESLLKDLMVYENLYNADYLSTHEEAIEDHADGVSAKLSTYFAGDRHPMMFSETEDKIPDNLIKAFEFSFPDPFDPSYSTGVISSTLGAYINNNNLKTKGFSHVRTHIEQAISKQKKTQSQAITKKINSISVNGGIVDPRNSNYYDFAFSIDQRGGTDNKFYFSLDAKYDNAVIVEHDFKLTVAGGTPLVSGCPVYLNNNDSILFVELFAGSAITFTSCAEVIFEGTFTLDNGKKIKIYKKTNSNQSLLTGVGVVSFLAEDEVELYGVNRIGVADFRKVEQEVCCYIPGEVSHIENILAKEYKEKSTRSLTRAEDTFESTSERELEELSDTTTTTRHEMSSEISKVIESDRQSNVGFSATTSGDFAKFHFDLNGYGDFSTGHSSTDSNSVSRTYAEDVTRRALERVVQKNTVKRTSKVLREFEENNKHGFDNREGTQHVTGVYRWIDKVYKNRLVNYGKRLIYEFMVPEPARFYKEAIIIKVDEESASASEIQVGNSAAVVKPTTLKDNGITSAKDITRENYERIAALYGVSTVAPMDQFTKLSVGHSESIEDKKVPFSFSYPGSFVPQDYELLSAIGKIDYNYKSNIEPIATITIGIGGQSMFISCGKSAGNDYRPISMSMNHNTGEIPFTVSTLKIRSFTISVELKCQLKASVYEQWQQDLYADLTSAYDSQLQTYNQAIAPPASESVTDGTSAKSNKMSFSNSAHQQIVRTELKRLCIEMMTKPFGIQQGKDFYVQGQCDVPGLRLSKNLDKYANSVKFFENAFDWDLLAENFYPYYWAKRCDWKELFQSIDTNDSYFQAFLQSGMSRILVPVKQGFEDAVTFFMETGNIWMGSGLVLMTDDEIYLSIADELNYTEGVVEGAEWETIVPTSLTLVQANSVVLDEGGLPCCEEDAELNLNLDTTVLQRLEGE